MPSPMVYSLHMAKVKRTPLVIGNWKMHPATLEAAKRLGKDVVTKALKARGTASCDIGIAVPTLYFDEIGKITKGKPIMLGAQNAAAGAVGAETGEVSAGMLAERRAAFVIVGHSERRARGEDNAQVTARAAGVLAAKMIPVVCIGEQSRDAEGDFYHIVHEQLDAVFANLGGTAATRVVVAYEPVWAIGTGLTPTAEDVSTMRLAIKKYLHEKYGDAVANKVRVLYGGSVTEENALEFMQNGMIDGFLVGGASLEAVRFAVIIKACIA